MQESRNKVVFCFELRAGEFGCFHLWPSFIHSTFILVLPVIGLCLERVDRAWALDVERLRTNSDSASSHLDGTKPSLSLISFLWESKCG